VTLFRVRGVAAFPADERAQGIAERIRAVAADSGVATSLDRNIQDVFNEYGVQMMTQAYVADPPSRRSYRRISGISRPPRRWSSRPGGRPADRVRGSVRSPEDTPHVLDRFDVPWRRMTRAPDSLRSSDTRRPRSVTIRPTRLTTQPTERLDERHGNRHYESVRPTVRWPQAVLASSTMTFILSGAHMHREDGNG
jgi:hypothetical protein